MAEPVAPQEDHGAATSPAPSATEGHEAPAPSGERPAPVPVMRFVPRHQMGIGHVPAPEEPELLSEQEVYVLGSLLAMASGFVLVGGGGLVALWWVFGDIVLDVLWLR